MTWQEVQKSPPQVPPTETRCAQTAILLKDCVDRLVVITQKEYCRALIFLSRSICSLPSVASSFLPNGGCWRATVCQRREPFPCWAFSLLSILPPITTLLTFCTQPPMGSIHPWSQAEGCRGVWMTLTADVPYHPTHHGHGEGTEQVLHHAQSNSIPSLDLTKQGFVMPHVAAVGLPNQALKKSHGRNSWKGKRIQFLCWLWLPAHLDEKHR